MAVTQKSYLTTGLPNIHGVVFDVHSGRLIDLNIDFEKELKNIQEIYDLGTTK
jgi:carbonic anhydrase